MDIYLWYSNLTFSNQNNILLSMDKNNCANKKIFVLPVQWLFIRLICNIEQQKLFHIMGKEKLRLMIHKNNFCGLVWDFNTSITQYLKSSQQLPSLFVYGQFVLHFFFFFSFLLNLAMKERSTKPSEQA